MKFNKFNKTGTKVQKDNNGTSRFSSESPGRTSGVLTALKSLAGLSLLLSACATVATVPPGAAVESSKIPAVETSVASAAQNNTDVGRLAELWSNGENKILPAITRSVPVTPSKAARSPMSRSGKVT
jgi:hypothetical protein